MELSQIQRMISGSNVSITYMDMKELAQMFYKVIQEERRIAYHDGYEQGKFDANAELTAKVYKYKSELI